MWDIQKYQGKLPSENSIIIGIFWSSCKKRWHIEPRVCENNKQSEFLYKSHFLDTSTVKSSLANLRSAAIWWRAILYSSINWVASCFPCAGNSDHWSRKRVTFVTTWPWFSFSFQYFIDQIETIYRAKIVNDINRKSCLQTKTFGPEAWRLSRILTLQSLSCYQAKYSIITMLCQEKISPLQEHLDKESWQTITSTAADEDEWDEEWVCGVWLLCWKGGGGGGEEGEKRFVFMMYFCTAKVTEIFRGSGSVFDKLKP